MVTNSQEASATTEYLSTPLFDGIKITDDADDSIPDCILFMLNEIFSATKFPVGNGVYSINISKSRTWQQELFMDVTSDVNNVVANISQVHVKIPEVPFWYVTCTKSFSWK